MLYEGKVRLVTEKKNNQITSFVPLTNNIFNNSSHYQQTALLIEIQHPMEDVVSFTAIIVMFCAFSVYLCNAPITGC